MKAILDIFKKADLLQQSYDASIEMLVITSYSIHYTKLYEVGGADRFQPAVPLVHRPDHGRCGVGSFDVQRQSRPPAEREDEPIVF